MDLTGQVVNSEQKLIFLMSDACKLDFENMRFEDLELLEECLNGLEATCREFRRKIRTRVEYMRDHNYEDRCRATGLTRCEKAIQETECALTQEFEAMTE